MKDYEVVIGLEVHVQLLTRTKIFCSCPADFGAGPNENTCCVCLGMPGSLPVLNRQVLDYGIMLGLATGCTIARKTGFARKHYFYPDLPKGYQITQDENPLCTDGYLEIDIPGGIRKVRIERIHMEEDAGKSIHDREGSSSLVDFNRAGVPLLEVVTRPDIRSATEAVSFVRQLRQIVMYLGICDGNMEEGSLRCDANISLSSGEMTGTRTEIKNLNSFRHIQKALEYEIQRHAGLFGQGTDARLETRLWDEKKHMTRVMRTKEDSNDYRYFPEPDLPDVVVDPLVVDSVELPELPREKQKRFQVVYGLGPDDAGTLVQDLKVADFFEECARISNRPREVANWILGSVLRLLRQQGRDIEQINITPGMLCELVALVEDSSITNRAAKLVFDVMAETKRPAAEIVEEMQLGVIRDKNELMAIVEAVVGDHPAEADLYRKGRHRVLGFFVGKVLEKTNTRADPVLAGDLIKEILES